MKNPNENHANATPMIANAAACGFCWNIPIGESFNNFVPAYRSAAWIKK